MNARTLLLVPATILLLLGPVGAKEETKAADAELERKVNEAIDRGAAWLIGKQDWNGSFQGPYATSYPFGASALPLLAVLHSGVDRESRPVRRGLVWLRSVWRSRPEAQRTTYGVSTAIMAVVESGRNPEGGVRLDPVDREWLAEMTGWLVESQNPAGSWWYGTPTRREGGYDNSNTQVALLALKEARRAGVEVPEEVFLRSLAHFLSTQERDGPRVRRYREHGGDGVYSASREETDAWDRARGWTYSGFPHSAYGSMTAGGVSSVAICLSEIDASRRKRLAERARESIRDGLAWLGRSFTVRRNPSRGTWHFYYLYGLERAGVLAGVVYMGGHRWYAEGAEYLVEAQGDDGEWRPIFGPGRPERRAANAVDQSFALLFLSRSTARALGVATERPLVDLTRGEGLDHAGHRTLFDAAFEEMAGLAEARAGKRAREFALLGPRVVPLLIRRLHSGAEAERQRAARILRAITRESFGFDAAGEAADREAAAARWTEWYLDRRGKLALDREALRIR